MGRGEEWNQGVNMDFTTMSSMICFLKKSKPQENAKIWQSYSGKYMVFIILNSTFLSLLEIFYNLKKVLILPEVTFYY